MSAHHLLVLSSNHLLGLYLYTVIRTYDPCILASHHLVQGSTAFDFFLKTCHCILEWDDGLYHLIKLRLKFGATSKTKYFYFSKSVNFY